MRIIRVNLAGIKRLYNVDATSCLNNVALKPMQGRAINVDDEASTSMRRCINVMCPLGIRYVI